MLNRVRTLVGIWRPDEGPETRNVSREGGTQGILKGERGDKMKREKETDVQSGEAAKHLLKVVGS